MNTSRPGAYLDLSAILWATVLATGTLLAAVSLLSGLFTHQNVWRTSWVVGAIFMGDVVLHWPAVFDFSALSAAFTALYIVALGYVLVLAWLILPWNWNRAVLAGGLWGCVCYCINLFGFTTWFPWLTSERNWIVFAGHLLFGVVAAHLLKVQAFHDSAFASGVFGHQSRAR